MAILTNTNCSKIEVVQIPNNYFQFMPTVTKEDLPVKLWSCFTIIFVLTTILKMNWDIIRTISLPL